MGYDCGERELFCPTSSRSFSLHCYTRSAEQKEQLRSAATAVLLDMPHSNNSETLSSRRLRGRRSRFGTLLQQLV